MDRVRDDALEKLPDPELVRLLVAANHAAMTVIFDRYCRSPGRAHALTRAGAIAAPRALDHFYGYKVIGSTETKIQAENPGLPKKWNVHAGSNRL
jgi:hypothetical protein